MTFADNILGRNRPDSIHQNVSLPRRQSGFLSPVDWRNEVLYFLLVDRFSDQERWVTAKYAVYQRYHPHLIVDTRNDNQAYSKVVLTNVARSLPPRKWIILEPWRSPGKWEVT